MALKLKFKNKLDTRKYNGAILLGLKGPVVKSHGATDGLGFSYSVELCYKIAKGKLIEKINQLSSKYLRNFLTFEKHWPSIQITKRRTKVEP